MRFNKSTAAAILIASMILSVIYMQIKSAHDFEQGVFKPEWESFVNNYQCPDWFRDVKFGIWAHWSAQCVPEQGDWYARRMYMQGTKQYEHHVANYGHPSEFGFMEFDNLWKAENWNPDSLMVLYKEAGARYFVALANHHDNFDNYDSKYHNWNSVNIGPRKDIVGIWGKSARKNGLYFGVSNHSAHAWHWFQPAYGYDFEGTMAGVRYDAATLAKSDGKGKWWEGLDPQALYTGPNMPMPDGLNNAEDVRQWHDQHDGVWTEEIPENNLNFAEKWLLRCRDLLDSYHPDLLYLDDYQLPFGQLGLDLVSHYYNANTKWNDGENQAVVTAKRLTGRQNAGIVEDFERGYVDDIKEYPWQTCSCIGKWHYSIDVFLNNEYNTVERVVHQLIDIVSKNGNLLLSIPMKGDGTIDSLEVEFLKGMGEWMKINGEAIYGTRPWRIYGEGPTKVSRGKSNENEIRFTPQDIRFTQKDGNLYAFVMGIPKKSSIVMKSLARNSQWINGMKVTRLDLLGSTNSLAWRQDEAGVKVELPESLPCGHALVFKIKIN